MRQYLGERLAPETPATLDSGSLAPTTGPTNRYRTVLFVEKEGFSALLAHALIAERFDIAIMSTKGMATWRRGCCSIAWLRTSKGAGAARFRRVAGSASSARSAATAGATQFDNQVHIVDLGLRLADVEEMDLQSEPVETEGDWEKRADTLAGHGATDAEIRFLRGPASN